MLFHLLLLPLLLATLALCAPPILLAGGDITFQARPASDDASKVVITLSTTLAQGWVAVGLGEAMKNADVWMLTPGLTAESAWNLTVRKSSSYSLPKLDPGQLVTIVRPPDASASPKSATFMRSAAAPGPENLEIKNETQTFIYAIYRKAVASPQIPFHESFGKFKYNAMAAEIPKQNLGLSYDTAIMIHGILMAIPWSFLSFAGALVARYMKLLIGPKWFLIHRLVFFLVLIMALVAFGFAIYATEKGNHFNNLHAILGLIIIIAMVFQIIGGIVIDKMFDPTRAAIPIRDKIHWFLGSGIVFLGAANVIIGHFAYETSIGLKVFNIVVIVIMFTAFIVGHFRIGQTHESH